MPNPGGLVDVLVVIEVLPLVVIGVLHLVDVLVVDRGAAG
jgi:hypothetical protein